MIFGLGIRLCVLLFLGTGIVMAGSPGVWEVFGDLSYAEHRDGLYSGSVMREFRQLYGAGLGYKKELFWGIVVGGKWQREMGRFSYHGRGIGNVSGKIEYLEDSQLSLGRVFHPVHVELMPYIGFHVQRLKDEAVTFLVDNRHLRELHYVAVPVGMAIDWCISRGWRANVEVQHDLLLLGVHKSDIDRPEFSRLEFNGRGDRLALKVIFPPSNGYAWFVRPYYQSWHIKDALSTDFDVSIEGGSSRTHHVGFAVGVEF